MNDEKSKLFAESAMFLGLQLKQTNKKGIWLFVGAMYFVKAYILNHAGISEPNTGLNQKDTKFVWGKKQSLAFDKIEAMLAYHAVIS